jgi:uncharacterized SAM-binding protein YcdF (DUF218 family)
MPRLRRIFRTLAAFLIGITVGALGLAYLLAGEIYDYQDSVDGVHLPKVDAIVCLAGGRGRIAAAGDLWYRYWEVSQKPPIGKPPLLYLSGMGHQARWNVLNHQLRRGVLGVIQPEDVLMETESGNTEANARWFAKYAKDRGWRKVILLTSPYHMRRARYIFDATLVSLGIPISVETLSVFQEPFEHGEWRSAFHGVHVTILEYLKWVYTRSVWKPATTPLS